MHSFLTFKASRKPQLVESGLSKEDAIQAACRLYENSKILSNHNLLASGVSVIVMTDEDAQVCVEQGRLPHGFRPEYQCGGW